MDYDFLDRSFLDAAKRVIVDFREAVESATPPEKELEALCKGIRPYSHCNALQEDFTVGAVDGSGEYPILQQDDIFVHFAVAAATCYKTETRRQHKLATVSMDQGVFKDFVILRDDAASTIKGYEGFLDHLLHVDLRQLAADSDYCEVFSACGRKHISARDVAWENLALSKASQVATHAYMVRSLAELGMAVRLLEKKTKYILIDTSLVYFLLGEAIYLPEIVKRNLICRANAQGTGVVALSKSHNIPNGDLIGRWARDRMGFKDHWYLRLPSEELGEKRPSFLREKEVPPKLGVSYLFKFHATSFPMRIDVDAGWWRSHIAGDANAEQHLFESLDYTCHDVRSYGYPYPMHAAHCVASLTKRERKAARDILFQYAQQEGILRGAFMRDPEMIHQGGI